MPNFLKTISGWALGSGLELGDNSESIRLIGGDSDIELLLHMDGADGGTVFTDNSLNQHAFTAFGVVGTATTSAAQKKFGSASGFLVGANGHRIESDDATNDIFFFTADFTIEGWVRFVTYQTYQNIGTSAATGNFNQGLGLEFGTVEGFRLLGDDGDGVGPFRTFLTDNVSSLTGLSVDTWYKFVVQRSGIGSNNLKIWLGTTGSLTLRGQATENRFIGTPNSPFSLGRYSFSVIGAMLDGYVDEYRIAKKAMYAGTPTAETSAFPNADYVDTSPVATMGNAALAAGTIINGVGDLAILLEGSSTIQAEYNANDSGWSAKFDSIALMNADLLANPITITDAINSFNIRLTFNSNGTEAAEAFISEGPNLVTVVCDYPAEGDVKLDVVYDDGDLTGALQQFITPLDVVDITSELEILEIL